MQSCTRDLFGSWLFSEGSHGAKPSAMASGDIAQARRDRPSRVSHVSRLPTVSKDGALGTCRVALPVRIAHQEHATATQCSSILCFFFAGIDPLPILLPRLPLECGDTGWVASQSSLAHCVVRAGVYNELLPSNMLHTLCRTSYRMPS